MIGNPVTYEKPMAFLIGEGGFVLGFEPESVDTVDTYATSFRFVASSTLHMRSSVTIQVSVNSRLMDKARNLFRVNSMVMLVYHIYGHLYITEEPFIIISRVEHTLMGGESITTLQITGDKLYKEDRIESNDYINGP